ncbi:hypothetical protein [Mannheimia haemolytica]|nr:hypothetical protein [Mannheimia haemolytica]
MHNWQLVLALGVVCVLVFISYKRAKYKKDNPKPMRTIKMKEE